MPIKERLDEDIDFFLELFRIVWFVTGTSTGTVVVAGTVAGTAIVTRRALAKMQQRCNDPVDSLLAQDFTRSPDRKNVRQMRLHSSRLSFRSILDYVCIPFRELTGQGDYTLLRQRLQ